MQLQTILNKVQKFKGYVYENVTLSQDGKQIDVQIRPRRGSHGAPRVIFVRDSCGVRRWAEAVRQ
jgi:hypothetical protein